jgi:hypothetical protein
VRPYVCPTEKKSGVSGSIRSTKCTVVLNVLCKRDQCVAEIYPAWPIWSRDLAPSTLSTYPPPYLLGYWELSLLVALNKDGPGQWSGHLQAAQPRTCGPRKMYVNIVLYFRLVITVFWNAYQMIICIVFFLFIFWSFGEY